MSRTTVSLLARLHRLRTNHERLRNPSRAVTRAANGIYTDSELAAFHAEVAADLLAGALTPREARGLTRAVEERRRGR